MEKIVTINGQGLLYRCAVGVAGYRATRSTGNPGFFREFFIEKFVTEKAKKNLQPAAQEGVRGIEATSWPQPYGASRRLGNLGSLLSIKNLLM